MENLIPLIFVILPTMIDLLADTNILIYAMEKGSVFYPSAKSILISSHYNIFITSKNISEFFAVASKQKFDLQNSLDFFKEIRANAKVLFPSEISLLIFETLIQQYQPKGNQVYDIEIVSIMMAHHIKYIATFNHKDSKNIQEIQILDIG
ncbi:MAG: type II toxin-antitoxin system VapC family toxin [Chitinophagaceae bacterium]